MSTDLCLETAEHICLAVRDRAFNLDDLLRFLAGRAARQPDLIGQVLLRLASWAPLDDETRNRNAVECLVERGDAGAIPVPCDRCGELMLTRKYSRPEFRVAQARGLCRPCYQSDWYATRETAGAAQ